MCKGSEESWPKRCPPRRCQLVFTWNQGLFRCWLLACNAPNELPERIGVGYAEIHAMAMLQGPGQLRRRCGGSKDRWDDRTFPIYELAEKGLNLFILPRANATISDKNSCRLYALDLLSKRRLPCCSRPDLFYV